MEYEFRTPSVFGEADPQAIGDEINDIITEQGFVTKNDLIARARKRDSALHKALTWNDKEAADKYRKQQITSMISNLVVKPKRGRPPTRAFVYLETEEGRKGYVSLTTALRQPSMHRQVLQQAFRELASFRRRYAGYKELHALLNMIRAESETFPEAKEA
jgi:hypothetical protein